MLSGIFCVWLCIVLIVGHHRTWQVEAFQWDLEEELPARKYFTFSERYMFADKDGPLLLEQGESFIHVDVTIDTYTLFNQTIDIGFAIYAADEGHQEDEFQGLCDNTISRMQSNHFAHNVESVKFRSQYKSRTFVSSSLLGLNGTYYHRAARIDYQYKVRAQAWHNVVFLVCADSGYYAHSAVAGASVAAGAEVRKTVGAVGLLHSISAEGGPPRSDGNGLALLQSAKGAVHIGAAPLLGWRSDINTASGQGLAELGLGGRLSAGLIASVGVATKALRPLLSWPEQRLEHVSAAVRARQLGGEMVGLQAGRQRALTSTSGDPSSALIGSITFRNPYGFLPAEMYGMLPCEAARMVAFVIFSLYYTALYVRNMDSALPLHSAFLSVFLFALAEATLWFAAYEHLNLTGQPYCCPFPGSVVAALLLQVFRQTCARALLLVVSLGYGIVRPKLLRAEWVALAVVSCLYLACAVAAQVQDILVVHDRSSNGAYGTEDSSAALQWRLPVVLLDAVFITWIYLAISSTVRILKEFNQTMKLEMYRRLVSTIGVFVALFTLMTAVYILDGVGLLQWPWQLAWMQEALWQALNFAVLLSVGIICRPSPSSHRLAYAAQLPTDDPDDYLDEEHHGREQGRLGGGTGLDDDGEHFSLEMVGSKHRQSHGFDALPAAEGDEEYGLDREDD